MALGARCSRHLMQTLSKAFLLKEFSFVRTMYVSWGELLSPAFADPF